jgi:HPt (histidine-containing phosphotransfer) domain-containing protein
MPAVDRGAVRQLEEQLGKESLAELVTTFLARTPDRLANLRRAVAADDASTVRGAADSLKGAARSFGAAEMGEIAARIEQDAAAGSLERADRLVADAAASFERTRSEFFSLLARVES